MIKKLHAVKHVNKSHFYKINLKTDKGQNFVSYFIGYGSGFIRLSLGSEIDCIQNSIPIIFTFLSLNTAPKS